MTLVAADPIGLAGVGAAVRALRGRAAEPAAVVRLAAGQTAPGQTAAAIPALNLAVTARRMDDVLLRVEALAGVIALVADDFARTEAGVSARFADLRDPIATAALAGGATGRRGLGELLDRLSPEELEALLVGSAGLARLVVDRLPLSPGSTAAVLDRLLHSGEPVTLVLREARALLLALAPDVRRRLSLLHPALVSSLASAPVEERFAATRVLVSAESARLRDRLPRLEGSALAAGRRRIRWYAELLTGVVVLTRPDGSRRVRPHQLLAFDPRGDGRIQEVFGDLGRARHLAVYVPGTGTSLERYSGNAARASAFAAAAPDLAMVLWQGADFPDLPLDHLLPPVSLWGNPIHATQEQLRDHVFAAAYRDAADRAGPLLARDVEGLRMSLPGPGADLTVLGHSYGGSVIGAAEVHGLAADRVVHVASAGGYVTDVGQYAAGECGVRRFSMTAPDDPIQLSQGVGLRSLDGLRQAVGTVEGVLPGPLRPLAPVAVGGLAVISGDPGHLGHGLDPDLIPGVTRLDTGVAADGRTLVSGHGGMFDPGSSAWGNLLAVMRGEPVQVLEPDRWHTELVPGSVHVTISPGTGAGVGGVSAGLSAPHYVITRSPYDAPGYQPPVESSTGPVCAAPTSW